MGRRESWGGRLRGIPRSGLGLMLGGGAGSGYTTTPEAAFVGQAALQAAQAALLEQPPPAPLW